MNPKPNRLPFHAVESAGPKNGSRASCQVRGVEHAAHGGNDGKRARGQALHGGRVLNRVARVDFRAEVANPAPGDTVAVGPPKPRLCPDLGAGRGTDRGHKATDDDRTTRHPANGRGSGGSSYVTSCRAACRCRDEGDTGDEDRGQRRMRTFT